MRGIVCMCVRVCVCGSELKGEAWLLKFKNFYAASEAAI